MTGNVTVTVGTGGNPGAGGGVGAAGLVIVMY